MSTIPAAVVPKNALALGAGYLYIGTVGVTAEPGWTVAGSIFTDAWTGWSLLGITREGHEFSYEIETDTIDAAEYLDPLLYVTTGRAASMSFEMMQVHATNFRRALNGGTLTTSGSGTTLLSTFTLPAIGAETRCQIGWEANDLTERWWAMSCFNTGSVGIQRQKGADNASLPVTWTMEPDASSQPIYFASAGTLRG